jgi:hypothetical protein
MSVFSSVKAHGGTTAQLATHQESLFVVYSGTTTRRSSPAESNISLRTSVSIRHQTDHREDPV